VPSTSEEAEGPSTRLVPGTLLFVSRFKPGTQDMNEACSDGFETEVVVENSPSVLG
jgi:hypothetical protein